MKVKFITLGGVLALAASLQASTALTITAGSTNPVYNEASPYSGVLGGTYNAQGVLQTGTGSAVTLICDDFNDSSSLNVANGYASVVTNVGSGPGTVNAALNATDTRYGGATGYPAATTLYDEMVWLATQLVSTSNASDQVEINEAIWQMTDPTGHTSPTTTYTAETQSYSEWMADAKYAVAGTGAYTTGTTAANYLTPTYSNWYVITDTATVGCTLGSGTGCTGTSYQEFLAYYNSTSPGSTTGKTVAPEPASFVLIGSGLLVGGLIGRRRIKSK